MSFGCWESNADVKAWMAKHAMGTNLTLLNNYYMSNLLKIIKGTMNKTAMFWRPGAADSLPQTEVPAGELPRSLLASAFFSARATISLLAGTVFDVYGAATKVPGAEDYGSTISLTTAAGHKVVRSAGLYLDQLCDTGELCDTTALQRCVSLCAQTDGASKKMCCRQLERGAREAPRHVLGCLRGVGVLSG